jgi:hypothetical protein
MCGEFEVARRQLAEDKLRSNKLQETIQQVSIQSICNNAMQGILIMLKVTAG